MIYLSKFKDFINWIYDIELKKKVYVLITLFAIGLYYLITYYEHKYESAITNYNNRLDSISISYTNKLEICNTENKKEYYKIIQFLQKSIQEQDKLKIETEKLKLQLTKK